MHAKHSDQHSDQHSDPHAAYALPPQRDIDRSRDAAAQLLNAATLYHARVMCLLAAAAVRDILTDGQSTTAFDAAALDLHLLPRGRVHAPGTYRTTNGQQRQITDPHDMYELDEWTGALNADNAAGWRPLCTRAGRLHDGTIHYRLDLTKACALPHPPDPHGQPAPTRRATAPENHRQHQPEH